MNTAVALEAWTDLGTVARTVQHFAIKEQVIGVTILWDFTIHTDRSIKANRPDIIVKDCKKKTCLWIYMTVPSDRYLSLKEHEKISKYKDLAIEIQNRWHLK